MKRILTLSLLLAVAVTTVSSAQGAKPDFSGSWKFDLAKSDFGQQPPPEALALVVVHKEPAVKISSTQTVGGTTTVNERNLTTDGKPNLNKLKSMMGDQEVTSTSKWAGAALKTTYTLQIQGMANPTVETWELVSPKVMTVTRKLTVPEQGELVIKVVYNKQ